MPGIKISAALHFVYRPCDLKPSVIQDARLTGVRVVCDASWPGHWAFSRIIERPQIVDGVSDLKIAPSDLLDPRLDAFIQSGGIERIWVELHPPLLENNL